MKKILATITIASLLTPALSFAQETITTTSAPIESTRPIERLKESRDEARNMMIEKKEQMTNNLYERASSSAKKMEASATRRASSTSPLGFCQSIDRVLGTIETKGIKLEDKRTENIATRDIKRTEARSSVEVKRDENQLKRESQLSELSKRATTDTEKQAVAAFSAAAEQALTVKKEAMDKVIASHQAEVDSIVEGRRSQMEKALTTFRSSIEAAKAKAKNDCARGVSSDTARLELKTAMEKAQAEFRTTVKGIEKNRDLSQTSVDSKKTELKKIQEVFISSLAKAKADLKSSLKNTRGSATSTVQ